MPGYQIPLNAEEFRRLYYQAADDPKVATIFWNTVGDKVLGFLERGEYYELNTLMKSLLYYCRNYDEGAFTRIHKGNPYYFIAITSYVLGDIEAAIYFFDAALSEDLRPEVIPPTHPITNPSPATRFLMLQGDSERQTGQSLTKNTESHVRRAIRKYNDACVVQGPGERQINFDDFQQNFLAPSLLSSGVGSRTLVTALITYCLEWDIRNSYHDLGVRHGTAEPFLLNLFKGCLLFESLLRFATARGDDKSALFKLIQNAQRSLGFGLNEFESLPKPTAFADLVSYSVKGNYLPDRPLLTCIVLTYGLRNKLGHNLAINSPLDKMDYQSAHFTIFIACLHVINKFWL